jgi:hypothetical protein
MRERELQIDVDVNQAVCFIDKTAFVDSFWWHHCASQWYSTKSLIMTIAMHAHKGFRNNPWSSSSGFQFMPRGVGVAVDSSIADV